ncbi:MAG: hypothetical protein EOP04_07120 [Proteobacteria bacterium]|nr:MAG: hypothetical protein EOP04_07120 [Pseudomonadota bacterium]
MTYGLDSEIRVVDSLGTRVLFVGPEGLCGISTVHGGVLQIAKQSDRLSIQNVDTVSARSGNKVKGYLKLYWTVFGKLSKYQLDVVYLQISQSGFLHQSLVLLLARIHRKRTVAHFHAQPQIAATTSRFNFTAIRWSRAYIDQFIVLS